MSNVTKEKSTQHRTIDRARDLSEIGIIVGNVGLKGIPAEEGGPHSRCVGIDMRPPRNYCELKILAGLQLANSPSERPYCSWKMKAVFLITDAPIDGSKSDLEASRYAVAYGTYTEARRRTDEVRHVWLSANLSPDKVAEIAANEVALAREDSDFRIEPADTLILIWRQSAMSFDGEPLEAISQRICQTVFTLGTEKVPPFQTPNE